MTSLYSESLAALRAAQSLEQAISMVTRRAEHDNQWCLEMFQPHEVRNHIRDYMISMYQYAKLPANSALAQELRLETERRQARLEFKEDQAARRRQQAQQRKLQDARSLALYGLPYAEKLARDAAEGWRQLVLLVDKAEAYDTIYSSIRFHDGRDLTQVLASELGDMVDDGIIASLLKTMIEQKHSEWNIPRTISQLLSASEIVDQIQASGSSMVEQTTDNR